MVKGALVIGAVVALTGGIIFSNRMSKKSDHTHSQEARRAQRKWVSTLNHTLKTDHPGLPS